MLASPRNWSRFGKITTCSKWSTKSLPNLPAMFFVIHHKTLKCGITYVLLGNEFPSGKIEHRWFKYFSITTKCHADIKHIPDFCNCVFYNFIFSACQAWCCGQICCHRWRDHTGLPQKVLLKLMHEGGWFRGMGRSRWYVQDYLIKNNDVVCWESCS